MSAQPVSFYRPRYPRPTLALVPPPKPLILIVDDEAYIAELVAELLLDEVPCEVRLAHNGNEALALARQAPPALIITDLMMPGMDGEGLARALRAEEAMAAIPLVTMSAARHRPAWVRQEQLPFLAKPFDPVKLLDTVQHLLP